MAYKRAPRESERDALLNCFLSVTMLEDARKVLESRMSEEQRKLLQSSVEIINQITLDIRDDFPNNVARSLTEKCKRCVVKFVPKPMHPEPGEGDFECMSKKEFRLLAQLALSAECSICMRRDKEVKQCELLDIWRSHTDTYKGMRRGMCQYAGEELEDE